MSKSQKTNDQKTPPPEGDVPVVTDATDSQAQVIDLAEIEANSESSLSVTDEAAAEIAKALSPRNVWQVEIPQCLLGVRFVKANNELEALEKYKAVCGIRFHAQAAIVKITDLNADQLPEGVELFGETQ